MPSSTFAPTTTVTVNTLAQASLAAYGMASMEGWAQVPGKTLNIMNNMGSVNYKAQTRLNTITGELIIANRGTDPSSIQNLMVDAQLSLHLEENTGVVA